MPNLLDETICVVRKCISSCLAIDIEKLTLGSSIGEFTEWDSMGNLTIFFSLQETFNVEIPLDVAGNIRSVEDWAHAITNQLSKSEAN